MNCSCSARAQDIVFLMLVGVSFAGWVNHIIICWQEERWVFLVLGAIYFPVGAVHGLIDWLEPW